MPEESSDIQKAAATSRSMHKVIWQVSIIIEIHCCPSELLTSKLYHNLKRNLLNLENYSPQNFLVYDMLYNCIVRCHG